MATNLQLDDALLELARSLGKHRTKREAVTQALLEYTRRLQQREILSVFGTVPFDEDYDYKTQRNKS